MIWIRCSREFRARRRLLRAERGEQLCASRLIIRGRGDSRIVSPASGETWNPPSTPGRGWRTRADAPADSPDEPILLRCHAAGETSVGDLDCGPSWCDTPAIDVWDRRPGHATRRIRVPTA